MYLDVVDLRAFYAERLGAVARRLIGARLEARWPSLAGERLLGIGYATPYLRRPRRGRRARPRLHAGRAGRGELAAARGRTPRRSSPTMRCRCPTHRSTGCSSSTASKWRRAPREQLREIWRVLAPGGRVIARRAEPARHLGAGGDDAVRLWPALQPRPAHRAAPRRNVLAARLVGGARRAADPAVGPGSAPATTWEQIGARAVAGALPASSSSRRRSSSIRASRRAPAAG